MKLELIISDLVNRGIIKADNSALNDIERKLKQFEYLIKKSDSINVEQKYLNLYDALFRLFEISLAQLKYGITNITPHKTFKELFHYLFPGLDESIRLNELVKLRHLVKKEGIIPTNVDIEKLEKCVEHARNIIKI